MSRVRLHSSSTEESRIPNNSPSRPDEPNTGYPLADMAFRCVQLTAENETLRERLRLLDSENKNLREGSEARELSALTVYASRLETLANDCSKLRQEVRRLRGERSRSRSAVHKARFELLVLKQRFGVLRTDVEHFVNDLASSLAALAETVQTALAHLQTGQDTSTQLEAVSQLLGGHSRALYQALASRQDRLVRGHLVQIEQGVVHISNAVDMLSIGLGIEAPAAHTYE